MNEYLVENIKTEVVEQMKDMANFGPRQRSLFESEVASFLREHEEQINESILPSIQKLMARGTDKLRFMFLEKGNTRWIFVKSGSEFQAILFEGREKGKVVKFDNEQDITAFVEKLKIEEGFKSITREGGIAKFLKSILRAMSALVMYMGVVSFVVTATLMVLVAVTPGAAAAGAGAAMAANVAPVAASAIITGAGWLMFKFSKKQDTPPETV